MARPRIAAVICSWNRSALLQNALDHLAAQTLDRNDYEVVVVDDGSTDDTRAVVETFVPDLRVTYVYQRHAGLASARNLGIFSTLAPILVFLDDDNVAKANLLEQHLDTHGRFPGDRYAVLGYTALDDGFATDPLMRYVTEVGYFLFNYAGLSDGQILDYTYFWGGCVSCKRSFLLQYGVFNPLFQFGCEDIELGFRLSRHNFVVVYNPHAASTMVRSLSFDQFCDRLIAQGRSNAVFSRVHPEAEVQRWTEVVGAEESWRSVAGVYDAIIRSARHLDTLARRRRGSGFELQDFETEWLHRAYWTACRAAKLKGIHERLREMDSQ
jgi:glycosyltransferase involved in cell wall biosynthesis